MGLTLRFLLYPRPAFDVSDNSLSASVHRHVFNPNRLLPFAPMFVQRCGRSTLTRLPTICGTVVFPFASERKRGIPTPFSPSNRRVPWPVHNSGGGKSKSLRLQPDLSLFDAQTADSLAGLLGRRLHPA
jgi:hypothetical protein